MTNPLDDLYFVTKDQRRGMVLGQIDKTGFYVVRWWGQSAHLSIVGLSEMMEWRFYDTVQGKLEKSEAA